MDGNNDKRDGYQWTTTACYILTDDRRGTYHRGCKIGYTRNSVGCFYDRMSLADVAVQDLKAYITTLHSSRTFFSPHLLLPTLPSTGFARVEAHLDKVVGFYSIYRSALNKHMLEYEERFKRPMLLCKRIELMCNYRQCQQRGGLGPLLFSSCCTHPQHNGGHSDCAGS